MVEAAASTSLLSKMPFMAKKTTESKLRITVEDIDVDSTLASNGEQGWVGARDRLIPPGKSRGREEEEKGKGGRGWLVYKNYISTVCTL